MFIIPILLLAFLNGSIEVTIIKCISPDNADTNIDEAQGLLKLKVNHAISTVFKFYCSKNLFSKKFL